MSGATNEVGAPETGLRFQEPVLTPLADDLHSVLGPVVTARRYPIISSSRGEARCVAGLSSFKNRSLNDLLLSRERLTLFFGLPRRTSAAHRLHRPVRLRATVFRR